MPVRRPAAVIAADKQHQAVSARLRSHAKDCGPCSVAIRLGRYDRCCDSGWDLAKQERVAAAQLRATTADHADQAACQLALW